MFQVVDQPHFYPSTTLLGNAGGPVVDTGIDMPVGGRVYVDQVEASEIARHFGFETPESARRRDARILELEEQLAAALARVERVRTLIVDEVAQITL